MQAIIYPILFPVYDIHLRPTLVWTVYYIHATLYAIYDLVFISCFFLFGDEPGLTFMKI